MMAITIIMCYEGWIPFDMAAAMILGQNIGTTITANLAAWVANYKAKRTARAHFIFNIFGVIWMLVLFYPFLYATDFLVQKMEGASPLTEVIAMPVALALFHTVFNIINMVLLINFIPQISRAVKFMVPKVEEKKVVIEQPRFLDKSSLKYPQTGMKALLDESLRLFEKTAYKVITHGLNVHRKEIESDTELKEVIKNIQIIELDVDRIYYEKFKNIYSKIVEYATTIQGQFELDEDKIKIIRNILRADRMMVEIVKNIKPLHQNMNVYLNSDNQYIREEYNSLRRMILKILRLTRRAKAGELDEEYMKSCLLLRGEVENHDVLMNGTIDRLVRDHLISNTMATSLMNDSSIAIQIARDLIDVSSLLYNQKSIYLEDEEDAEEVNDNAAT
jgi:phosphate:Na+ symporter